MSISNPILPELAAQQSAVNPTAPPGGNGESCAPHTPKPTQRTPGLRAFDIGLYPILTNGGVFAVSVAATYLTSKGNLRNADGKLVYGKIGEWFHNRGNNLVGLFKDMGMSTEQANMSKMVFFSWFDGSLLAPVVKVFEDHRERIAYWADKKWGTLPKDLSVYDAEPEQNWGSVLGGRLATCAVVVPTAYALDRAGLNKVLFSEPGRKFGEWLATKPVAAYLKNYDIPELAKTGFFEGFYTSVCTAGLYFSSRCIASLSPRKHKLNLEELGEQIASQHAPSTQLATLQPDRLQPNTQVALTQPPLTTAMHMSNGVMAQPAAFTERAQLSTPMERS